MATPDMTAIDSTAPERSRRRRTRASSPSGRGRWRCRSRRGARCRAACRWRGWTTSTTTRRSGSAQGEGAHFTDVDGHTYLDLYVADMSAFCGHAPAPVAEAVARRMELGNQFLLPGEDAIAVAEHLAGRYGLPKWQFTSPATQANTEVIRLARELTGREVVLLFDGKYHGEGDATLVVLEDGEVVPEHRGPAAGGSPPRRASSPSTTSRRCEAALAPGDVALVLAEPAMTNAGFLLPEPGFHDALRRLTREAGTLLAIDETHTLVCAYAGLAREWGLEPDFLSVGKSIAAGVPLAAYGMRDEIAALIAPPEEARVVSGVVVDEVSTGGTLFANALSMAAGRAALLEVLTAEAFERTAALGERMAAGLRAAIERAGLPWSVVQHGAHAFYFFVPEPPHRRRRLARRRRPRPARADPRLHGQSRRVGVGLVAGPDPLGRPRPRRRRPLRRDLRRVPDRGDLAMSHMRTTMQTQPDELRRLLADRDPAQAAAQRMAGRRTWLVGIGTSWHAAHHGAWLLGAAGLDAFALHAADVAPYAWPFDAADAVIVLSHTGQTGYTAQVREAAREAGATVVHVTGIGKGGDLETVAPETSYAYTASHTGALMRLAQIAVALGADLGELTAVPDAFTDYRGAFAGNGALVHRRNAINNRAVAGITSPVSTSTTSPLRSVAALTLVTAAVCCGLASFLATTSRRVLRSASACALPRPSAIASAKLANSTVNHSHAAIAKINPAGASPLPVSAACSHSAVVRTLPTSTQNMTGFLT